MNLTVCIASYGDPKWAVLAAERAYPSVSDQLDREHIQVVHQPGGDIATSRNAAARLAQSEWLCFLDADDELDENFVFKMKRAIAQSEGGKRMFTPRVSYVLPERKPQAPKYWPEVPLNEGNWLIIGTVVPRDLFLEVGGFEEWPHAYEDWHLFAKLWKAGAVIERVPGCIYLAHVMKNSRNKNLTRQEQVHWHYECGKDLFPDDYPPEWKDRQLRPTRERRKR